MSTITEVKRKFQQVLGFQHLSLSQVTPSRVRSILRNQSSTLMQAIALETTGKDFWIAVDGTLDRIAASRTAKIKQAQVKQSEPIPTRADIERIEAERLANPVALNHWLHNFEGSTCDIPQLEIDQAE